MSGGLRKMVRYWLSVARCSSWVPGSVMATNWLPAFAASPPVADQDLVPEVALERAHLDGAARLRRDQEQGLSRSMPARRGHRRRVGAVEHLESDPLAGAEGVGQHLGAQRAAAHAQEHRVPEAGPGDAVGEGGQAASWSLGHLLG
jgi:hypothetical protein